MTAEKRNSTAPVLSTRKRRRYYEAKEYIEESLNKAVLLGELDESFRQVKEKTCTIQ